jgi:serine/threonine protein kinase
VILGNDGSVTLIDFGLARNLSDNQRLTRQGGLVGTPAYMAPEMMAREDIDGRVDIFALGLTFYFLLTGEAPFLGSDIHDLFLGKARLKAPELYTGNLSASYRYALQRLLAKDRQDRYPNAQAAIRELTVLAGGGDLDPTSGDGTKFWLWQRADGSSLDLPRAPARPVRNTTDDLISGSGRRSAPPAPPPAPKTPPPGPAPKAPARPKPSPPKTPPHRAPAAKVQPGTENPLVREIERASRNPGNRIEECVLLSTLEEGSVGTLHRAWDMRESRLVAVRVVEGLQSLEQRAVESLRRIQALNHPRIPKLRRFGLSDEHELYLITDLVRGRSIRSYRHKPKSVVIAIRDVAQALQHANSAGAFHGSLLPECVMIDKDGAGHLLDFGLHHALENAIAGGSIRLPRISSRYKPPERLRSPGTGDARSEVYGLGAVFYYGLARQPPGTGDIIAPRKLRGGIPRPIQDVCLRCLKHAPNERYPDAGGLAADLDAFIQTGPRRRR